MKRFSLILLSLVSLFLFVQCGGEFIEGGMLPEDCLEDEYYDSVDEMCYIDEEAVADVGGGMLPEDCFEDEYYDEADQMCYIDESYYDEEGEAAGGSIRDWLVSVAADLLDNDIQFSDGEGEDRLVSYTIDADNLISPEFGEATSDFEVEIQENTASHEALWNQFAELIPADNRDAITVYGVFTDGPDEVLAYVEPNADDPTTWAMILDPADSANQQDFVYTLIHEYGHVLTLNDRQVPFDEVAYFDEVGDDYAEAEEACPEFFTGEGCSRPESYINLFFEAFWTDIYDELPFPDVTGTVDPDELYAFYERYEDQFVTDYAATNPGEDIAESWTHFVLKPRPTGETIAEQKILFFYQFPELVELRGEILSRVSR